MTSLRSPTESTSDARIVVGVNDSDSAIDALQWAGRIGAAIGIEIDAVISWEVPPEHEYAGGAGYQPVEEAEHVVAEALTAAFGDARPSGLRTLVRHGRPAKVLVAAGKNAEMLVVGSRGHSSLAGLFRGSVSAYCAQHASCPVVVAHPPARPMFRNHISDRWKGISR